MSMFTFETRACVNCGSEWEALAFWSADTHCYACNRSAYERKLAEINAQGRAYRVDTIGGACPTQATGQWVDGRRFYFRARHGEWTLEAGDTDHDAIFGDLIAEGDDPSGGWMEWDEVLAILDREAARV